MQPLQQILGSKPIIWVLNNTAHSLTLSQTTIQMMMMTIIIIIIIIINKNSLIGHCTHTTEGANVKAQNIFYGRNNITCKTNCKYRTVATLCTLETWCVPGI